MADHFRVKKPKLAYQYALAGPAFDEYSRAAYERDSKSTYRFYGGGNDSVTEVSKDIMLTVGDVVSVNWSKHPQIEYACSSFSFHPGDSVVVQSSIPPMTTLQDYMFMKASDTACAPTTTDGVVVAGAAEWAKGNYLMMRVTGADASVNVFPVRIRTTGLTERVLLPTELIPLLETDISAAIAEYVDATYVFTMTYSLESGKVTMKLVDSDGAAVAAALIEPPHKVLVVGQQKQVQVLPNNLWALFGYQFLPAVNRSATASTLNYVDSATWKAGTEILFNETTGELESSVAIDLCPHHISVSCEQLAQAGSDGDQSISTMLQSYVARDQRIRHVVDRLVYYDTVKGFNISGPVGSTEKRVVYPVSIMENISCLQLSVFNDNAELMKLAAIPSFWVKIMKAERKFGF